MGEEILPIYKLDFIRGRDIEPDDLGMEFKDLHHAYLEVCKSIPDLSRDILANGEDPMTCTFIICDDKGRKLMAVPFVDILSPAELRLRRASRGPHSGFRSDCVRDDLAVQSFRQIFSAVNAGCILLTPELHVKDINEFGARHGHVDPEAIRGTSVLTAFNLQGQVKTDYEKYFSLAQRGIRAELIDLPHAILDQSGTTANGWWNSRVWPIFDDDDNLLGLANWAEPFASPTAGGNTIVRIIQHSLIK